MVKNDREGNYAFIIKRWIKMWEKRSCVTSNAFMWRWGNRCLYLQRISRMELFLHAWPKKSWSSLL